MSRLTQRERRFVSHYHGLPAREIARIERLTITEVLEIWQELKVRGVVRSVIDQPQGPACEQLSLDQIDRMMRGNRAPVAPSNDEIGWTPDTDGCW